MADESGLVEHCNFEEYPEVGMVGLDQARQANEGIDRGACEVLEQGIDVNRELGESLLETALSDIVKDVESLLK